MSGIYKSYHFVDHDPILDAIDTLIEKRGVSFSYIERKSGVTVGTLRNWHKRKTKRPQFPTIKAVVKACGGTLNIMYDGKAVR